MAPRVCFIRRVNVARVAVAALLAASAGCGRGDVGATVEPLGALPQSDKIQGRDGGCSGVAFGRSVWTFGDTVLDEADATGSNWHHNSYSLTDDLIGGDGIGGFVEPEVEGGPRYFVPPTEDEAKFNADHAGDDCAVPPCRARFAVWPGPPLWDEERGRALVFYGLIYAEPGDFNFQGVGQSLGVWHDVDGYVERPVLSSDADHPTLMWSASEPPWGAGAVIDGERLYALECVDACALAMVPVADALDKSAWRVWDGDGWTSNVEARAALFAGAPTVNLQRNGYLGLWTAIYAEPLSNDVVMRTAPEITGPWSDPALLFVADKPEGAAYDANVHREYQEQDGKVMYVTFSRSNGKGWFGSEMQLVRVTLP